MTLGPRRAVLLPPLLWLAIGLALIAGGAALGPGLVYAKLQSDAAVYLVQARHLWFEGSAWNFAIADGTPPILYTPVPAYLRAPLFGLAADAGTVVLLVQLQNLVLLGLLGVVSQRYLVRRLPAGASAAWQVAPWLCLALTYNPWIVNLALPMGDHLFALLTMGSVLAFVEAEHRVAPRARWLILTSGFLMTAVAAVQKVTGAGALGYAAVLAGRGGRGRWVLAAAGVTALVTFGLFGGVHRHTFGVGASHYLSKRDPALVALDTVLNLVVAAVPNQLVPNFSYLLARDFSATHAVTTAALTGPNLPWLLAGCALTALVAAGAWRERRRLAPELAMLALTVPVYALATNSTSRYLASMQPVFWLLAVAGGQVLTARLPKPGPKTWAAAAAALLVAVGLIATNLSRSFSARHAATAADLPDFLRELARTFESGQRDLLARSARQPAPWIVLTNDDIRWYALAGARYLPAAGAAAAACRGEEVYTVFACDARNCERQARRREAEIAALAQALQPMAVFDEVGAAGRFRIERWRPRPGACTPDGRPAEGGPS